MADDSSAHANNMLCNYRLPSPAVSVVVMQKHHVRVQKKKHAANDVIAQVMSSIFFLRKTPNRSELRTHVVAGITALLSSRQFGLVLIQLFPKHNG
jgi:hypothetical protein